MNLRLLSIFPYAILSGDYKLIYTLSTPRVEYQNMFKIVLKIIREYFRIISDTILNGPSGSSRVTIDSPSVYVSPTESSDLVSRYLSLVFIRDQKLYAIKQSFFHLFFPSTMSKPLSIYVLL